MVLIYPLGNSERNFFLGRPVHIRIGGIILSHHLPLERDPWKTKKSFNQGETGKTYHHKLCVSQQSLLVTTEVSMQQKETYASRTQLGMAIPSDAHPHIGAISHTRMAIPNPNTSQPLNPTHATELNGIFRNSHLRSVLLPMEIQN